MDLLSKLRLKEVYFSRTIQDKEEHHGGLAGFQRGQ